MLSKKEEDARESEDREESGWAVQVRGEDLDRLDGSDERLRFDEPAGGFGWDFYVDLDGKGRERV